MLGFVDHEGAGLVQLMGARRGVEETHANFGGRLRGLRNCSGAVVCNLCGRMETAMAQHSLGLAKCCVYH